MATVIDAVLRLKDQMTPILHKVTGELQEHEKVNIRTSKSISKTGDAFTSLGAKISLMTAPLTAAATAGLKLNAQFEAGMAKISTLVDTNVVSMNKLKQGIRDVSDATGESVTDLAEAEYQAISAGVDAAHVTQFLGDTTKAAVAGFTDNKTAIDGVTTVLNSYGMAADQASKITDQMLLTQNLGKTTFGELAQSIGQVTPVAVQLHVSTDELFASLAALTKNGINTAEAMTSVRAVMNSIIKPSSEAAKTAQELGLDFSAAHVQSVGFAKFMDEVKEKTGGNVEVMGKLFSNTRALTGVLSLTGNAANDFKNSLDAMKNSAGATDEAFEKMMKNDPTRATQVALNSLHNAAMDFGAALAPLLLRTSKAIKTLADVLRNMDPAVRNFIYGFLQAVIVFGAVSMAIGKVITMYSSLFSTVTKFGSAINKAGGVSKYIAKHLEGFKKLGASAIKLLGIVRKVMSGLRLAMLTSPLGIALLALTVVIGIVITHFETFKEVCMTVWNKVSDVFNSAVGRMSGRIKYLQVRFNELVQKVSAIFARMSSAIDTHSTAIETILNTVGSVFTVVASLIIEVISTAVSVIADVISTAIDVFGNLIDFVQNVFAGNWSDAWNNIKNIFSDIWNGIKNIAKDVLNGISGMLDAIIGKSHDAESAAKEAKSADTPGNWTGTPYFSGGVTWLHEQGPELVKLPTGAEIIPHSESMKEEYRRGLAQGAQTNAASVSVSVEKLADSIVVREEADIDKIAETLVFKIKQSSINMMKGALV